MPRDILDCIMLNVSELHLDFQLMIMSIIR